MPKHAAASLARAEWRRLSRFLWAGTAQQGPVGTVEHGRRFTAVDTRGAVVARCRTLEDAEALLEHLGRETRAAA